MFCLDIPTGVLPPMRMLNACGVEMESMHVESAREALSGGTGHDACGPVCTGPQQDWGPKEISSTGPTEAHTATQPTTVQFPFRCTNSYAYL